MYSAYNYLTRPIDLSPLTEAVNSSSTVVLQAVNLANNRFKKVPFVLLNQNVNSAETNEWSEATDTDGDVFLFSAGFDAIEDKWFLALKTKVLTDTPAFYFFEQPVAEATDRYSYTIGSSVEAPKSLLWLEGNLLFFVLTGTGAVSSRDTTPENGENWNYRARGIAGYIDLISGELTLENTFYHDGWVRAPSTSKYPREADSIPDIAAYSSNANLQGLTTHGDGIHSVDGIHGAVGTTDVNGWSFRSEWVRPNIFCYICSQYGQELSISNIFRNMRKTPHFYSVNNNEFLVEASEFEAYWDIYCASQGVIK